MNQIQSDVMHQIFQQADFQQDIQYSKQDFLEYMNSLINYQFPFELQLNPNFFQSQLNPSIKIILLITIYLQQMKFNSQLQIKQDAINQIQTYKNEYKQLLEELKLAKKEENLNEHNIDVDSTLFITVCSAECLKPSQYFVIITLLNEEQNTQQSQITNHPIWQEEFKMQNIPKLFRIVIVTSPYNQIIIELFNSTQILIGQLKLPLYQFKDQQSSNQDYLLEDEHGVLINTKLKLNLTIWWIHSKVALLEDQISFIDEYKKEIKEQQDIIEKSSHFINSCVLVFNESRIAKLHQHPYEVNQEPNFNEESEWTNKFQNKMCQIAKQFINKHSDSLEEWQQIVLIINGFVIIFTLVLISMSRPCFQQLTISLLVGMLIMTYDSDHIKTSKILPYISLILFIQSIFDVFWLIVNYVQFIQQILSILNPNNQILYYLNQDQQMIFIIIRSYKDNQLKIQNRNQNYQFIQINKHSTILESLVEQYIDF